MRLCGLVRKEFLQVVRDPSSIAIAFLMPVILLLLFGYGVSLDAEHVPLAVVVEQPSADTELFMSSFQHSRYFDPLIMYSMDEAIAALIGRRVDGIVRLAQDFDRQMRLPAGAFIQVNVNGIDANNGRLIMGYIEGVWGKDSERQKNTQAVTH